VVHHIVLRQSTCCTGDKLSAVAVKNCFLFTGVCCQFTVKIIVISLKMGVWKIWYTDVLFRWQIISILISNFAGRGRNSAFSRINKRGVVIYFVIIILIIIITLTAIELSLGGCSLYTSTDKTNKNKYT